MWGCVHRQRAGPLHRAVSAAGHAVTASRVGKPEVLGKDMEINVDTSNEVGKAGPQAETGKIRSRR